MRAFPCEALKSLQRFVHAIIIEGIVEGLVDSKVVTYSQGTKAAASQKFFFREDNAWTVDQLDKWVGCE